MSGFDDFMANLGFGSSKNTQQAQQDVANAESAYGNLATPNLTPVNYQGPTSAGGADASQVGPSAMNNIPTNTANTQAQTAQMSALQNLAANGGRNAASDSDLAAIQENENANARGQREAIMQNADARGQGSSGAALVAQLDSAQNATNNQSAKDLGVSGQEAQTALQAGEGAAGIGSNLQNQQFGEAAQTAAANDAINKFNAQNSTGVSEFNSSQQQGVNNATAAANNAGQTMNYYQEPEAEFGNQYQKAGGEAGADLAGAGFATKAADTGAQQGGNILGGVTKLGTAILGGKSASDSGDDSGDEGDDEYSEGEGDNDDGSYGSTGGSIPGIPTVPGDSPLNDTVKVNTSPGEVVVPRTLAATGTPSQIGSFVKNPPTITPNPTKDKAAMLSALKRLGRK